MTKRLKKKMLNVCIAMIQIVLGMCIVCAKQLQSTTLDIYDFVNAYLKNFSLISTLLAVTIAMLLISLSFGPFKICEFLTVCWIGEVMWIWFRGE